MSKKSAVAKKSTQSNQAAKQENVLQNVHVDEFDISRYSVNPIDLDSDFAGSGSQYTAFPRYKYPNSKKATGKAHSDTDRLILITDPIKMVHGGLPKLDGEWRKTEGQCQYFWLPLMENDPAGQALLKVLQQIDDFNNEKINTDKNASKFLRTISKGKESGLKQVKYASCVKEFDPAAFGNGDEDADDSGDEGDEEEKSNKKSTSEKYLRTKVRIATVWNKDADKDAEKEIKMKVYINDGNGNPKSTPEPVSTMEDLRKLFTFNSTIQFAIELNKLWIMKNVDQETKVRKASIGLKCLQIYVSELAEFTGVSSELGSGVFGFRGGKKSQTNDEEEAEVEEEEEEAKEEAEEEEEEAEEEEEEAEEEEEEAEEEAEEEEEEPEPEPEPVPSPPKKGAKGGKTATPPAPPATTSKKPAKKPEPVVEEEEEEPEPVKKPSKTSGTKKTTGKTK